MGAAQKTQSKTVSLADLVGLHPDINDEYIKTVEAWTDSRINLLRLVQQAMQRVVEQNYILPSLEAVFANISEPLGSATAYGSARLACLKDQKTDKCAKFNLGTVHGKRIPQMEIFLVIKSVPKFNGVLDKPYSGLLKNLRWVGDKNPVRELLMGKFLNQLVKNNISPHFPIVYEHFQLKDSPTTENIVMELCNLDATKFIRDLFDIPSPQNVEVFEVMMLQLVQALAAADSHYRFRHNDLHAGNAMMTYITNGVYTYKVGGKYYDVPNHGMCWKLIDFGWSSSKVFGENDSADLASSSNAMSFVNTLKKVMPLDSLSVNLFDLLRLVAALKEEARETNKKAKKDDVFESIDGYINTVIAAARESSDGDDSLVRLQDAYRKRDLDIVGNIVSEKQAHEDDVLAKVFQTLAAKFEVPEKTVDKTSDMYFDMSKRTYAAQDVLTGYESQSFSIDSAGKLTRAGGRRRVRKTTPRFLK